MHQIFIVARHLGDWVGSANCAGLFFEAIGWAMLKVAIELTPASAIDGEHWSAVNHDFVKDVIGIVWPFKSSAIKKSVICQNII